MNIYVHAYAYMYIVLIPMFYFLKLILFGGIYKYIYIERDLCGFYLDARNIGEYMSRIIILITMTIYRHIYI